MPDPAVKARRSTPIIAKQFFQFPGVKMAEKHVDSYHHVEPSLRGGSCQPTPRLLGRKEGNLSDLHHRILRQWGHRQVHHLSKNTLSANVELDQRIVIVETTGSKQISRLILNSKEQDTVPHLAGSVGTPNSGQAAASGRWSFE